MRVSLIIAVYKDVESLSLIIQALKRQTYKNFEVIIAEDGKNIQMKEYIYDYRFRSQTYNTRRYWCMESWFTE